MNKNNMLYQQIYNKCKNWADEKIINMWQTANHLCEDIDNEESYTSVSIFVYEDILKERNSKYVKEYDL